MKVKHNKNENEQEAHLMEDEDNLAEELVNEPEDPPVAQEANDDDTSLGETAGVDDAVAGETAGVGNGENAGVPTAETVTEEDSDDEEDVAVEMDHRYGPWSHDHDL